MARKQAARHHPTGRGASDGGQARDALTIRMAKQTDGSVVLSCRRADGTTTWQRNEGSKARFFWVHDLTHYAVETTLDRRQSFYGLVASGWDLSDFGTPWPRGPLPPGADVTEVIVGVLDRERVAGVETTAADLNAQVGQYLAARAPEQGEDARVVVTEEQLVRIRATLGELIARWYALPAGGALELPFPAGSGGAGA